jgi:hypothetical protein
MLLRGQMGPPRVTQILHPEASWSKLATASASPSIIPRVSGPPPTDATNAGSSGFIMSPTASLNSETRPRAITGLGGRGRVPADGEAAGRINTCMSLNRICYPTKADFLTRRKRSQTAKSKRPLSYFLACTSAASTLGFFVRALRVALTITASPNPAARNSARKAPPSLAPAIQANQFSSLA